MASLVDYGLIIIVLAIFGFFIKDAFFQYRKYTTPYDLLGENERIFSYVSLAVWIISIIFISIITIIQSTPGAILYFKPFFDGIEILVKMGLISQADFETNLARFIVTSFFLFYFAIFYAILYFISMVAGIISMFLNRRSVEVSFNNDNEDKKFRRIIHESDEFMYFELMENFRNWRAIPKSSISDIRSKFIRSRFDNFLVNRVQNFRNEHPFWGNFRNVRYILLILLIIYTVMIVFSNYIDNLYIRIISIIITIPLIILILIYDAFNQTP